MFGKRQDLRRGILRPATDNQQRPPGTAQQGSGPFERRRRGNSRLFPPHRNRLGRGFRRQHVERNLQRERARATGVHGAQGLVQGGGYLPTLPHPDAASDHGAHRRLLIQHLVQCAGVRLQLLLWRPAGDQQQRRRLGGGRGQRRERVDEPRTGRRQDDAGTARGPGVAVGHEAGTLLVAHVDMADAGMTVQRVVDRQAVDSRDPEDRVYAPGVERRDHRLAARNAHAAIGASPRMGVRNM